MKGKIMTDQEFFDKTCIHLDQQGKRAFNKRPGIGCRYRTTKKGQLLMCAIGCHIPNKLYKREMENNPADMLLEKFPELNEFIPNKNLAYDLQCAHDGWGWESDSVVWKQIKQQLLVVADT